MITQKLRETLNNTRISYRYRIVKDKKGAVNLAVRQGSELFFLYGGEDARENAAVWARDNRSARSYIIIAGAGLGYHISEMLKLLTEDQRLYIFETNLPLLKTALEHAGFLDVLSDERVFLYAGDSAEIIKPFCDLLCEGSGALCCFMPSVVLAAELWLDIFDVIHITRIQNSYEQPRITAEQTAANFGLIRRPEPYRIGIVKFHNENTWVRSFLENLALGFEITGCETFTVTYDEYIDATRRDTPNDTLGRILSCDFIVCCNICGVNGYLSDVLGKTFISLCIDRPYHFADLYNNCKNIIYTWIDRTDARFAGELYFKDGANVFLPHGAELDLDITDVFTVKRRVSVVVSCNYEDGDSLLSRFYDGPPVFDRDTVREITDEYIKGNAPWETVIRRVTGCSDDTLRAFMAGADKDFILDWYLRFEKKLRTIRALLDNGITVHCFGGGWDKSELYSHPLFLYHGFADYNSGREIIKHAKIVINITAYYLDGSHERVFSAMIRGALCIADYTDYLAEEFTDGGDIVFYDHRDLDGLARKVKYYLENEEERVRITKAAFEKVKTRHTWYHRALQMLEIYKNYRAR